MPDDKKPDVKKPVLPVPPDGCPHDRRPCKYMKAKEKCLGRPCDRNPEHYKP